MVEGSFYPYGEERGWRSRFLSLPEIDPHYRVILTTQEQEYGGILQLQEEETGIARPSGIRMEPRGGGR